MLKIFKRKKGMILVLGLAILFSVIMGMLFVRIGAKKSQFNAILGETQLGLIEKYTEGEKILFYVDQAAKYSIYDAIDDLSSNVVASENKCGTYRYGGKEYVLWQSETESIEYCMPDYKANLGKVINEKLDAYFDKEILGVNIPKQNYDFVFEEGDKLKISGIATVPISIKILCGKDRSECGVYKVKPSFSHEVDYNLSDYAIMKGKLKGVIEDCKAKQDLIGSPELQQCVDNKMGKDRDLEWEKIVKEGYPSRGMEEDRVVAFNVVSDKKMPSSDNNIVYKFAIFIPDKAAPPKIENLVKEKEGGKVKLMWDESKALDVVKYKIYYNEESRILKPDDMFNIANELVEIEVDPAETYYEVITEKGKNYYFAVTVVDEVAGNEIKEGIAGI